MANNFSRLVNYEIDNNVGWYVPKVKVDGANKWISSTFKITDDAFSTLENRKLVNNKTYYFVTVAYAHNEYLTYAPDVPVSISSSANLMGQKKPYLEGRKLKRAAGIPHNIDAEKFKNRHHTQNTFQNIDTTTSKNKQVLLILQSKSLFHMVSIFRIYRFTK